MCIRDRTRSLEFVLGALLVQLNLAIRSGHLHMVSGRLILWSLFCAAAAKQEMEPSKAGGSRKGDAGGRSSGKRVAAKRVAKAAGPLPTVAKPAAAGTASDPGGPAAADEVDLEGLAAAAERVCSGAAVRGGEGGGDSSDEDTSDVPQLLSARLN